MIFNTPPSKAHLAGGGGLQKSPHHKSTSALNELKSTPYPQQQQHAPKHASISATHSLAYRPQYKQSFSSDRSYVSDYTETPSYFSSFTEDFDVSPPSSVVSANTSAVSHGARRGENSLRDFDLTEEYLQHFSREQREGYSPTPSHPVVKSTSQPQLSPRQPNTDSGLRFQFPPTSSPVSGRYKRGSSPNVGPVEPKGGYSSSVPAYPPRFGSSSPELYLPTPNLEGYSNSSSHHPPGNLGPVPSTRPGSHPGYNLSAAPSNSQWYDNEAMSAFQDYSRQQSASFPSSGPNSIPRRQSEESYDLQEMLKIWAESSQNPFSEGTLV